MEKEVVVIIPRNRDGKLADEYFFIFSVQLLASFGVFLSCFCNFCQQLTTFGNLCQHLALLANFGQLLAVLSTFAMCLKTVLRALGYKDSAD